MGVAYCPDSLCQRCPGRGLLTGAHQGENSPWRAPAVDLRIEGSCRRPGTGRTRGRPDKKNRWEGKRADGQVRTLPDAIDGVAANVEAELGLLPGLRTALGTHIDEAAAACKMQAISASLAGAWNEILAVQAEAAQTRIENACAAIRTVSAAYREGDQAMMDEATRAVTGAPNVLIEDGKDI